MSQEMITKTIQIPSDDLRFFRSLKAEKGMAKEKIIRKLLEDFLSLNIEEKRKFLNDNMRLVSQFSVTTVSFSQKTAKSLAQCSRQFLIKDIYTAIIYSFRSMNEKQQEEYYLKKY